jgi:NodT family efflux transporter outer membrane factor (OMF) lipoprotein
MGKIDGVPSGLTDRGGDPIYSHKNHMSGKSQGKGSRVRNRKRHSATAFLVVFLVFVLLILSGCAKVGPDFVRPDAPVSAAWLDAGEGRFESRPADYRLWWKGFNDPVLDRLIETAYRQNPSLSIAGVRVLEARARLGIAVGSLYPQTQRASGYIEYNRVSERSLSAGLINNFRYDQTEGVISASWEIDFWGRMRRLVESADASWMATVADYDAALVSLTADVASTYISIRTLEKRIDIARRSVDTETEALKIVEARFRLGAVSGKDVEQAKTLLSDTKAAIPPLESRLRQAKNAMSALLGLPPNPLKEMLAGSSGIPRPPPEVAVGIPADLLRRRPDIRSVEHQAHAQSALIGVAKADLFPAFSLIGFFGFLSTNVGDSAIRDVFQWRSREYSAGPAFSWNLLNYGRLTGNVRAQDARLQQLLISYQATALKAQQEVEDALAAFLRSEDRALFLSESVRASRRALDIANAQYREGAVDFTAVIVAEQTLLAEQDNLAGAMGDIAVSLVATYRALGGGWEIREGKDFVPDGVKETMAKRTDWGNLLEPSVHIPDTREEGRSDIRTPDW